MSRRTRKSKNSAEAASKELKSVKTKQGNLINSLFMRKSHKIIQLEISYFSLLTRLFSLDASSLPQKYTLATLWENHKKIDDILAQLIRVESGMFFQTFISSSLVI